MKCKCGCGNVIIYKEHHRWYKPKFIYGHSNRGKYNPVWQNVSIKKIERLILKGYTKKDISKELETTPERVSHRIKNYLSELKEKVKENARKKYGSSGPKNPRWLGGKSFEPYSYKFNKKLKTQIKERDNYKCQNKECLKNSAAIHHIDYNKQNCNKENLISLCSIHHAKSNSNRNYWEKYYINILQNG